MSTSSVIKLDLSVECQALPEMVTRFQSFATKTVEGILEMGRVVNEASKLKLSEYARFCELVGLDGKESTLNKLRTIGEKYEFLLDHSSKLPSSWTTVYEIARLSQEQITKLIDIGVIKTTLVAKELNLALGKEKKYKAGKPELALTAESPNTLGFRVVLKKSPDRELTRKIECLLKQLEELPLDVDVGSTLKAFFEPVEA
jgi:hypothetical protein